VVVGDLWFQVTEDIFNNFIQFLLGATKTASSRQTPPQGAPLDDVIQVQAVTYLLLSLIQIQFLFGGYSKKKRKNSSFFLAPVSIHPKEKSPPQPPPLGPPP